MSSTHLRTEHIQGVLVDWFQRATARRSVKEQKTRLRPRVLVLSAGLIWCENRNNTPETHTSRVLFPADERNWVDKLIASPISVHGVAPVPIGRGIDMVRKRKRETPWGALSLAVNLSRLVVELFRMFGQMTF